MTTSKLTTRVVGILTICPTQKAFALCEAGTGRVVPLNIGDILIADDWQITADPGAYKKQGEEESAGHLVDMPEGHFVPQIFLKTLPHPDAEKLGLMLQAYVNQQPLQLELKAVIVKNPTDGLLGSIEPHKAATDLKEKLHWRLFRTGETTLPLEAGDTLTLLDNRGNVFWCGVMTEALLKGMEAGFKKFDERLPEWDLLFNAMRTQQRALLRKAN